MLYTAAMRGEIRETVEKELRFKVDEKRAKKESDLFASHGGFWDTHHGSSFKQAKVVLAFSSLRGYWGMVQRFIPRLRFKKTKSCDQLAYTNSTLYARISPQ